MWSVFDSPCSGGTIMSYQSRQGCQYFNYIHALMWLYFRFWSISVQWKLKYSRFKNQKKVKSVIHINFKNVSIKESTNCQMLKNSLEQKLYKAAVKCSQIKLNWIMCFLTSLSHNLLIILNTNIGKSNQNNALQILSQPNSNSTGVGAWLDNR
jgi:hypothetical protein